MTCVLQVAKHSLVSLATATREFGRILGSEEATRIVLGRKFFFLQLLVVGRHFNLGPHQAGLELSWTTSKLRLMNGLVHVIFPTTPLTNITIFMEEEKKNQKSKIS